MTQQLCVYGSLKVGFYNNYLLKGSKFLGSFWSDPEWTMHSMGGFPALTRGAQSVFFEVYEVDKETLLDIYSLEGYSGERDSEDNWYDTTDINTPFGVAEVFYFKGELNNPVVASGCWGE